MSGTLFASPAHFAYITFFVLYLRVIQTGETVYSVRKWEDTKMAKNYYRDDGRVWFDDHICEIADLMLGTEGIRYIYLKKHDRSWIRKLGDDGVRFAFMSMTEVQLRIIELLIFEDRTVTDIRRILDLTITELRIEIKDMRKALLAAL